MKKSWTFYGVVRLLYGLLYTPVITLRNGENGSLTSGVDVDVYR